MKRLCALACAVYFSAHLVLESAPAFGSLQDYPLHFQVRREGAISEIVARNDGPSTMSAHLTLSGTNIASDKVWPINITLQRYSSQVIASLWPLTPDRPMQFSYRANYHFGDAEANHSTSERYRLPFEDGKTFPVGQAYGGVVTTHNDKETQYAIDFSMPEGTVVVAARAGLVVDVTIGHSAGAWDAALLDKANSVIVLHDDGTIAEYAHLAQRPAMVSRGQRVAAGDRLAFSGNTGYSSGPHLHFAVSRPVLGETGMIRQVAMPIIFFTHNPPTPFIPRQGEMVSSTYDRAWDASGMPTKGASRSMGASDLPGTNPRDATDSNARILWRYFVLERTGVPTWGWIVLLLAIWLFVRARRKPIHPAKSFDRQERR